MTFADLLRALLPPVLRAPLHDPAMDEVEASQRLYPKADRHVETHAEGLEP